MRYIIIYGWYDLLEKPDDSYLVGALSFYRGRLIRSRTQYDIIILYIYSYRLPLFRRWWWRSV